MSDAKVKLTAIRAELTDTAITADGLAWRLINMGAPYQTHGRKLYAQARELARTCRQLGAQVGNDGKRDEPTKLLNEFFPIQPGQPHDCLQSDHEGGID